jgi:hypothetical protein
LVNIKTAFFLSSSVTERPTRFNHCLPKSGPNQTEPSPKYH